MNSYAEIVVWAAIGIYGLWLKVKGEDTISRRAEDLLPRWADVAIIVALLAWVAFEYGATPFVVALRWCMLGHILLGHETYKK